MIIYHQGGAVFMTNGWDADRGRPNEVAHVPVRVFISYAHDDHAHEDRVRDFWSFLRANGIDAQADIPAAERRQDWAEWMMRQVRDADHVLVIASPEYRRRAEGDARQGEGLGVQWEARLIRDRFYANQSAGLQLVIPVVLPGCAVSDIPLWLAPAAATHYLVSEYTAAGAEKLLRLLTGQPWETEPPLGARLVLSPRDPSPAGRATSSPLTDGLATPDEFREDLVTLLDRLDVQARRGRLPRHLPAKTDVIEMSRTVRVWAGLAPRRARRAAQVRRGRLPRHLPAKTDVIEMSRTVRVWAGIRGRLAGGGTAEDAGPHHRYIIAKLLPKADKVDIELPQDPDPARPWPEVAAEYPRLMVLADPGLGKSWLIRTETHRLCHEAMGSLDEDPSGVIIPVPLRCDQLSAASGRDLADKAASFLVAQQLVPERSRARLAAKIRAGQVVLLLDAFDELTRPKRERLREMVRTWADLAGDQARCVITSRIAGHTGSPIPDACEVELQPFTTDDIAGVVNGWHLPSAAASELQGRAADPAVAAMSRIPLMLSFLCSLAAQPGTDEIMPKTRGELFNRVLRWFLTREHRSHENFAAPVLDDIGVDELLQILGPLAFTFAAQPAGWIDLMPADRLLEVIDAIPEISVYRDAAEVLRVLTVGAGILVPAGDPSAGRNPGYLFTHRAVAEYLVARHLATLPEPEWLEIVEQHRWFDSDWAEVIPMLGERLDRAAARTLIENLLATETDPFHHTLFIAIRIWGARPDADHLLPSGRAADLAAQIVDLISHERVRAAISSKLAAMAYLPQVLLTRLLDRLAEEDRAVRKAAVEALARRDTRQVTEALVDRLADESESVRVAAVKALAGHDVPQVIEALLDRLADESESVRVAAVEALAGRDTPEVTQRLLDRLADGRWYLRNAAVAALAGRDTPEVTQRLLDRLADGADSVRVAAVEALAGRDTPEVTERLLDRLADRHWSVRAKAVAALAGRDTPEVTQRLLDRLADKVGSVQTVAIAALAGRDTPEVTKRLLDRLADENESVRGAAVKALAGRDTPEVTRGLLDRLAHDQRSVQAKAVAALAGCDAPGVTEALLNKLADRSPTVRASAIAALADRHTPQVTQGLLDRLTARSPLARATAAAALIWHDTPQVTKPLLAKLNDWAWPVRAAAVVSLSWRDTPEVTNALLAKLNDRARPVRATAVAVLAARTTPKITQALLDEFADQAWATRVAAKMTWRDAPEVTQGLLERLVDQSGFVREMTEEVIAEHDAPEVLIYLAKETERLMRLADETGQVTAPPLVNRAEQLMTQFYRRIEPSEQSAVLNAMGWLTRHHW